MSNSRSVPISFGVGALLTIAVVVGAVTLAIGIRRHGSPTCGGQGHPSPMELPIDWSTRVVQLSAASRTGNTTGSFSVSQVMDIPTGATGLRVDIQVFGVRNAPIFPDPVSIDVAPDRELPTLLCALADDLVGPHR